MASLTQNVQQSIVLVRLLFIFKTNFLSIKALNRGTEISQISLKYLHFCYKDEQKFYGFGTTRGWVNDDRIIILSELYHIRAVYCKYYSAL